MKAIPGLDGRCGRSSPSVRGSKASDARGPLRDANVQRNGALGPGPPWVIFPHRGYDRYRANPDLRSKCHGEFVPIPDSCIAPKLRRLLYHLVGARNEGWWDRDPERLCRLEIDDQFELGSLVEEQLCGLCPTRLAVRPVLIARSGWSGSWDPLAPTLATQLQRHLAPGCPQLLRRLSGPALECVRECAHVVKADQPRNLRYMQLAITEVTNR
jgi:hypothetical protein